VKLVIPHDGACSMLGLDLHQRMEEEWQQKNFYEEEVITQCK